MRLLLIEDDEHLHQWVEKFIDALINDGYEIYVLCDCYNKIDELKNLLEVNNDKSFKPDIIAFFSTFTYTHKLKAFEPLFELITYPIELWSLAGECEKLRALLPKEFQNKVKIFDVFMEAYYNKNFIENHFKREK